MKRQCGAVRVATAEAVQPRCAPLRGQSRLRGHAATLDGGQGLPGGGPGGIIIIHDSDIIIIFIIIDSIIMNNTSNTTTTTINNSNSSKAEDLGHGENVELVRAILVFMF